MPVKTKASIKKKKSAKKIKRPIMQKRFPKINILFVCTEGVLRSPTHAKAFSEYIAQKKPKNRFVVSYSGNKPTSISFKSKVLTADIVVAFSPKIALSISNLVAGSKVKPEVIVFGKIGGSVPKTNYAKLTTHALKKFGH